MDYRGRGYSEGKYATYGNNEIDDVYSVINFLKENGYSKRGAVCGVYEATKFPDLACVVLDSPSIGADEDDDEDEDIEEISKKMKISKEKFAELMPEVFKKISEMT